MSQEENNRFEKKIRTQNAYCFGMPLWVFSLGSTTSSCQRVQDAMPSFAWSLASPGSKCKIWGPGVENWDHDGKYQPKNLEQMETIFHGKFGKIYTHPGSNCRVNFGKNGNMTIICWERGCLRCLQLQTQRWKWGRPKIGLAPVIIHSNGISL